MPAHACSHPLPGPPLPTPTSHTPQDMVNQFKLSEDYLKHLAAAKKRRSGFPGIGLQG